ncbi:SET domain-containing protein [Serendipita vermifera]|nr:SET domain-containing protein [Serendipita vermifera]
MSRYINLKKSTRVRLGKVLFGDKKRSASLKAPQFCIQAKQAIPRGTYIWELNGVISADIVEGPTISSMEAHKSQNLAKGPRLFAGPARFINHSCVPNATLYPVPNMHCLVAFSTRKISPGEEITISYGSHYWSGSAHCCCRTCSGCDPLYSVEMDLGPPVSLYI